MKYPWRKWFPRDWLSDAELSACAPATRGIWKDWLDRMMINDVGELSGTIEQLAQLGRCSPKQCRGALEEVSITGCGIVTKKAGVVTVVCRRLQKESKRSEQNRLRVERHRRNARGNGGVTAGLQGSNGVDTETDTEGTDTEGLPPSPPGGSGSGAAEGGSQSVVTSAATVGDAEAEAVVPSVEQVVAMGLLCVPVAAARAYCVWWHGEMTSKRRWLNGRGMLVNVAWELGTWWRQDQGRFMRLEHRAAAFLTEAERAEIVGKSSAESLKSTVNSLKNGAETHGSAPGRGKLPAWRELEILEEELERHPCNPQSRFHDKNAGAELKGDWQRKRARVRELRGVGAVGVGMSNDKII